MQILYIPFMMIESLAWALYCPTFSNDSCYIFVLRGVILKVTYTIRPSCFITIFHKFLPSQTIVRVNTKNSKVFVPSFNIFSHEKICLSNIYIFKIYYKPKKYSTIHKCNLHFQPFYNIKIIFSRKRI
jgi:hypothetical protein